MKRWCCLALFLLVAGSIQAETIRLGLGFDNTRNGHGFDLHKVGETYMLFFYTYDDVGEPEWLLGVAEMEGGVISGPLQRFTYDSQSSPPQVLDPAFTGRFSLDWRTAAIEGACNDGVGLDRAEQLASFYWQTGSKSGVWCTQFLFGGEPDNNPYHGGVWSAGTQDQGYGFSMSQQGQMEIAIVYYYDGSGQPRWALGHSEDDPVIDLDNYQGYCRWCASKDRLLEPAGAMSLEWDQGSEPGSGSDFASLVMTYPLAPFGNFDRDFRLVRLSDGTPRAEVSITDMPAQDYYDTFISDFIVQDRCINCHVEGGLSGHTRLVFQKPDQPGYRVQNLAKITSLVEVEGADYPLNKVRGAAGHGGGIQVPSDSPEYSDLVLLFEVLDQDISQEPDSELFANVGLLPWDQTLRRAALIFAGRLPTAMELAVARGGDEAGFRATIRGLMEGDAFHEFLIESANDRLLTDKWLEDQFFGAEFEPYYPEYKRLVIENIELTNSLPEEERHEAQEPVRGVLRRASAREPLELIAHIVEMDRPYTEVVTADYTMVNPLLAEAYQSDTAFENPLDHNEWRKGWNDGQLLIDETYMDESIPNQFNRYLGGGIPLSMPHSGVLNSPSLLARYPSTATNRNRARSRWTYYFFLGVNIEKLAARTRDPDALADKNNPTMNNPACTVCHVVMDPVAGAFQNYGDVGFYRDQHGGEDSLPDTYKYSMDSDYLEGDTWYRDMRAPGFGSQTVSNPDNSIQWLGQRIAGDPRFASGTVKFWWPAVFGRFPLEAPEEANDADFAAKLVAFETQSGYIESVADKFRAGLTSRGPYNLKDLLVEFVMGPWFRARGLTAPVSDEQMLALEAGFVGAEKLLTPEQLERKTEAITGYVWHQYEDVLGDPRSGLRHDYRVYYGGIDSDGINRRSAEITSVMSNVVAAFAAESACPIVATDFLAADNSRRLFAGLSHLDSPVSEVAELSQVGVEGYSAREDYSLATYLSAGNKRIRVEFLNDYYVENEGDRNLYAMRIRVSRAGGQEVDSFSLSNLTGIPGATHGPGDCNGSGSNGWAFYCRGFLEVPVNIDAPGEYTVTVTAYGDQAGPEDIQMLTSVLDTDPFGQSAGAQLIRERLVQWHELFFGEAVETDGPEVAAAYELLVEIWQRNVDTDDYWLEVEACNIWSLGISEEDNQWLWADPQKMFGAWRLMLTYFLTDYRYIFE